LNSIIAEFEEEKKIVEDQKTTWQEKQKKKIADSEKVHKENGRKIDEARSTMNNANQKFISYQKKIDDAVVQLNTGKDPQKIRQTHETNRKTFTESLHQLSEEIRLDNLTSSDSGPKIKQGQPKGEEYYRNKEDHKD